MDHMQLITCASLTTMEQAMILQGYEI